MKRVLTRDGDSSYYLNGQHVRRRDVQDIFLGTGLGPRAYSIIEQGMISRVIDSKPEELRVFLEEAAGVSKYRERRRETELRLEDTRENLSRVADIQAELTTQLEHLAQQAEVAAKYQDLQAQLALNHNLLAFTRLREAEQAKNRYSNEVQKVTVAVEAEMAKLRESERALEELRGKHYESTDHLQELQGALYSANAEVQSLEQEINFLAENRRRMGAQLEALSREALEVERRMNEANAERDRCQAQIDTAQSAIAEREAELARAREALPAAESAAQQAGTEVRATAAEMNAAEQAQGVHETRESHALKLLSQFEARKNRLKQENMALVFPEPAKLAALEERRGAVAARVAELDTGQREAEARLPKLEEGRRETGARLQEATRELAGLEASLKALEAQQARLDTDSKLKDWVESHALGRGERLWQAIHVEAGWDDAVEAALGVRLNAVKLADDSALPPLLRDAPPGNFAVFVERGAPEAAASASHLKPLAAVVSSPRPGVMAYLRDALAQVFILPDGEDGMALARVLPAGGLLVAKSRAPLQPPGRRIPRPAIGAARRAAAPARDRGPAGPHSRALPRARRGGGRAARRRAGVEGSAGAGARAARRALPRSPGEPFARGRVPQARAEHAAGAEPPRGDPRGAGRDRGGGGPRAPGDVGSPARAAGRLGEDRAGRAAAAGPRGAREGIPRAARGRPRGGLDGGARARGGAVPRAQLPREGRLAHAHGRLPRRAAGGAFHQPGGRDRGAGPARGRAGAREAAGGAHAEERARARVVRRPRGARAHHRASCAAWKRAA